VTDKNKNVEETALETIEDAGSSRRGFLKKGALVGAAAAAMYVAPKISSVGSRPAYAQASPTGTPPPPDPLCATNVSCFSGEESDEEQVLQSVLRITVNNTNPPCSYGVPTGVARLEFNPGAIVVFAPIGPSGPNSSNTGLLFPADLVGLGVPPGAYLVDGHYPGDAGHTPSGTCQVAHSF